MKLVILIPIYNDWDSSHKLIEDLCEIFINKESIFVKIYVINDGSTIEPELKYIDKFERLDVTILNLQTNVGHQKAIAIGLCEVLNNEVFDYAVVMDGDGEDSPENILDLIQESSIHPDSVIVATRIKRTENYIFQFFYFAFKLLFYLGCGKKLNFGNFTLIPKHDIKKLVHMPSLWTNYPSTILKAGLEISKLKIPRSNRYFGISKLTYWGFLRHGIGAISVFAEKFIIRVMTTTSIVALLFPIFLFSMRLHREITSIQLYAILIEIMLIIFIIIQFLFLLLVIIFNDIGKKAPIGFYREYLR